MEKKEGWFLEYEKFSGHDSLHEPTYSNVSVALEVGDDGANEIALITATTQALEIVAKEGLESNNPSLAWKMPLKVKK